MEQQTKPDPKTVGAESEFLSRFGYAPTVVVAAPGRVNLIGEHIDYNDGFVLPLALEQQVVIAAAKPNHSCDIPTIRIYSSNLDQLQTLDVASNYCEEKSWLNYIRGVIAGFVEKGHQVPSFDAVISSSVPVGGGLSSSAAIEVATATLLEELLGQKLPPHDKALLCQRAEHQYAGVPCGIMDQFSSVFGIAGQLMLIDCRSKEIQYVPFSDPSVSVLITNSNVKHELGDSEYSQRRETCDSVLSRLQKKSWRDVSIETLNIQETLITDTEFRRARHVVTEINRTLEAANAIRANNWNRVGELMFESHRSLRDDFEVSCLELNLLVDLASEIGEAGGVIGSRMTGAGFGGCTVSLVKTERLNSVVEAIAYRYEKRTGVKPDCFASKPSHGARVVKRLKR